MIFEVEESNRVNAALKLAGKVRRVLGADSEGNDCPDVAENGVLNNLERVDAGIDARPAPPRYLRSSESMFASASVVKL
ncbi:hypothetical protein [Bradyrhizobium sp. Ai1a-2]|uniref:hypothetical protein n=1 Tax=Bradyrhizobium sp. Ai1a-2 TaxID=196490 RepID=UPI001AEBABCC|nr:hypothetical protein [Bradyrhizobium sp. Ai1a-2]